MKVFPVLFSSAVVLISTSPEVTNAQDGRFDAGYDETILLKLRSKASFQAIDELKFSGVKTSIYRIQISIS